MGCRDVLQFKSEIQGGYSAEMRLCLRPKPRQRLEYAHMFHNGEEYARARALVRYTGVNDIYAPVWGEWQRLDGSLGAVDTVIPLDTTWGDWRVGGLLAVWASDSVYVVKTIASITPTDVTLTTPVGQSFVRPVVTPVRTSYIMEGASVDRQAKTLSMTLTLCVRDNIDLSSLYVSTYPQYQSLDVITDRPWLMEDVQERIIREAEFVDSELGRVAPVITRNRVMLGQTLMWVEERRKAWYRRTWVHALRGKQKKFWMPTFNYDLVLQDKIDPTDVTILVRGVAQLGVYIGQQIMIEKKDGTRYFRSITNATSSTGGNHILQFATSLGVTILQADVQYVSFIYKSRLVSDDVSMEHRYNNTVVTTLLTTGVPD